MPEEIRGIREEFELSQAAFEQLLGVGAKTVVRWEKGTVFQNKSTDSLLRIVRQFPDAARALAEQNGVELPSAAHWPGAARVKQVPLVFRGSRMPAVRHHGLDEVFYRRPHVVLQYTRTEPTVRGVA